MAHRVPLVAGLLTMLMLEPTIARAQLPDIIITPVDEQLTKLWVNGYVNVLLLRCDESHVLVDAGFEETAEQLASKLRDLGVENIEYLINTHSNGDHTGGNALLGGGSTIISHATCRDELADRDGFPEAGLPTVTITDTMTVPCGSSTLELIAMPGGHTNGDIVVHFPDRNIVYLGDIIIPESFPVIWLDQYGDEVGVEKLIDILKTITEQYEGDTRFLSAHGRDYSMEDMREYRDMVVATTDLVRTAIVDGKTLEQMEAENLLGEWTSWNSRLWEWINSDFWIETVYRSVGG